MKKLIVSRAMKGMGRISLGSVSRWLKLEAETSFI